jgi:ankyrin repeat protein
MPKTQKSKKRSNITTTIKNMIKNALYDDKKGLLRICGKEYSKNILNKGPIMYRNFVALKLIDKYGKKKGYLEQINDNNDTALLLACKNNIPEVALKLISMGEIINPGQVNKKSDKDQGGNTALIWACSNNMEEVALKLIENFGEKTNPENVNTYGYTALQYTIINKNLEVALKLISMGEIINPGQVNKKSDKDQGGNTALIWACSNNMEEVALKLIENFGEKTNPENVNTYGYTALQYTIINKNLEVALKLIEKFGEKTNPQSVNVNNDTALILAIKNNMPEVALKLIEKFGEKTKPQLVNGGYTVLILAIKNEMSEVALKLIEKFGEKTKPQLVNTDGNTALLLAIKNEMSEVALKLIENFGEKTKPEQKDRTFGNTALEYSIRYRRNYQVILALLKIKNYKPSDQDLNLLLNMVSSKYVDIKFINEINEIKEIILIYKLNPEKITLEEINLPKDTYPMVDMITREEYINFEDLKKRILRPAHASVTHIIVTLITDDIKKKYTIVSLDLETLKYLIKIDRKRLNNHLGIINNNNIIGLNTLIYIIEHPNNTYFLDVDLQVNNDGEYKNSNKEYVLKIIIDDYKSVKSAPNLSRGSKSVKSVKSAPNLSRGSKGSNKNMKRITTI